MTTDDDPCRGSEPDDDDGVTATSVEQGLGVCEAITSGRIVYACFEVLFRDVTELGHVCRCLYGSWSLVIHRTYHPVDHEYRVACSVVQLDFT